MKNQFGQVIGNIIKNWQPRKAPILKEIKGNFCTLLPLDVQQHAKPLFNAFQLGNQGEIYTYLPFGPFETYDSFQQWLHSASLSKLYFTICDLNSNTFQGIASFHDIDTEHGVVEVGSILYSKLLQKTAAGTEAMYLMMREVFEKLGYRRYQWRCNALNLPSRKAAERLGFTFEGIFRQHYIFKDRNRDTAWYSIIDTEWPNLKFKFERWLSPNNFDDNGNQIVKLNHIVL
jgi:RimJ/RimL family protein N-acetyltransferase